MEARNQQRIEPAELKGKVLVRIKPKDARRGINVETYAVKVDGKVHRYYAEAGWYVERPGPVVDSLRECVVDEADSSSPYVFDVCTPEEALRLQQRESRSLEQARPELIQRARGLVPRRAPRDDSGLRETAEDDVGPTAAEVEEAPAVDREPDISEAKAVLPDVSEEAGRMVEVGRVESAAVPEVVAVDPLPPAPSVPPALPEPPSALPAVARRAGTRRRS